ncbi:hypothetical protein [Streptomyces sp. NBC_00989]|uniref:hypothetical protein n=1 Tax=Streptomyces sp. NBC_00989 TaxID=2903705 RepID=UPI00386C5E99|nr:hypothetical protein OG714_00050 [Streptomyces sp. NBC_00989]WSW98157.1 hypothetical protein OG714_54090 [Streptomyces sp. NBC_00989]
MRYRVTAAAAALAFVTAGCSSAAPSNDKSATPGPSPSRSYLHPVKDLYRVKSDCEAGGSPQLTFWLRNHAAHSMAYDIRYEFLDSSGKVVGSAEGVFAVAAHQLLGDEGLYGDTGRCGPTFRLAYINAYDSTGDGAGRPHF